jgi:glycosyltransferase involved in cell wall biosynthesis
MGVDLRLNDGSRSPIRVVMVVRELGSGGIERDVAKIANGLPRELFEPYVATYKPEGARYDELRRAGVPVIHIALSSLKSPKALLEAMKFGQFLMKKRIKILHAWDASAVFTVPLARFLQVPVVLASTLGSRELLDARSKAQVQFTDRFIDAAVVNCEAMRRHLVNDYALQPSKIELCYNGVDVTEFYPKEQPRVAEVSNADFVIGTVCVLRVEKALELLIEAFAAVRERATGIKLLIVGSGPELSKLQSLTATLGITQETIFVPAVPKVADYMRSMDLFVSTSYSEAFSNSILEAMACGCCIVASRVGGTPELVADGERGLLFQSGDPGDLASKITALIENPERRQTLAQNGARFASEKLNISAAVKTIAEIYYKMLKQKNVRIGA